jgi:dipeptidyl aminopeptidase/acylaminoacyl peptidase
MLGTLGVPDRSHVQDQGLDQLLAFSPDGDYLAAVPSAHRHELLNVLKPMPVRVFHVASGKEITRFFLHAEDEGNSDAAVALTFSPDGHLLAVVEKGRQTVQVLEVASGQTRLVLSGHRSPPTTLAFSPDGQTLASGGNDNVIYLWDVTGARSKHGDEERGSPPQLDAWWKELSSADADRAGEALAALIRTTERSVPFLKEQLRPVTVDEKRVARLIANLDADVFAKREAASRELAELGDRAKAALFQTLKNRPSPEVNRRIEELLEQLDRHTLSPEEVRSMRAVEALEHIGTPEARKLLEALANGAPEARLTREAKASLQRLKCKGDM